MKMSIEVELAPFKVPTCVGSIIPGDPFTIDDRGSIATFKDGRKYLLEELSVETLEALCAEFRLNVFKEAKKEGYPMLNKGFNTTGNSWEAM